MKTRSTLFFVLALVSVLLCVTPAIADSILYNNGPLDDDTDAWTINFGFAVSDSFTLTSTGTLTGFRFNAWLFPGDVLQTAEISITSGELGGTVYFDQVVNFAQSDCFVNAYGFNVCAETSHFNGPTLDAGTYWITLENAQVNTGDPVYWDENSGEGCTSPGCPSLASQNSIGTIPSESFTILGNSGTGTTVPEPGSVALLGSGAVLLVGALRRKLV
jgi:hypothetical protein